MPKAPLAEYNKKRDFSITEEPAGVPVETGAGKLAFVIQKHDATRMHYDFRLEWDGVMWSWSVPRGPSLDPKDRRLAVRTEDHPIPYKEFEGQIPKGQYGAGAVIVWDQGTWEPLADPLEGLRRGKIAFKLHGERCRGEWRLVRSSSKDDESGKTNWFLLKKDDDESEPGVDLPKLHHTSVKTGRTIQDVWEGRDAPLSAGPFIVKDGVEGPIPQAQLPEMPTLAERAPDGWLHEVKQDGYRALIALQDGVATITTRRGNDWTHRFVPITRAAETIDVDTALIDGEVVVRDAKGISSFPALQQSLASYPVGVPGYGPLEFVAFDLLYAQGKDLRDVPLRRRKELLRLLIDRIPAPEPGETALPIHYGEHLEGRFAPILENARALGLEGLVSKDPDAPYREGRSKRWLKVKVRLTETFEVSGYYPSELGGIASLHVKHRDDGTEAGGVGTGFDGETRQRLLDLLAPMAVGKPKRDGYQAVSGGVLIEVEYAGLTAGRNVRHASFIGIRDDLMEKELPTVDPTVAIQPSDAARAAVGRLRLTHPEKELWVDLGVTKAETVAYYAAMAERVLPGLVGRPVSIVRCPEGVPGPSFFQKHWHHNQPLPAGLREVETGEDEPNLVIEDIDGLLALIQMSVVELHPWGARADDLEHPDRLIWDLDPDEDLPWAEIARAAHATRARLTELGLQSFARTTGGKGLHVVIPLEPTLDWEETKHFVNAVAASVQRELLGTIVLNMSKKKRKGKIFMDVLRNQRGATAVATWSTRARPGAKVAVPIDWSEVDAVGTTGWDVRTVWKRLATRRTDPWATFEELRQEVPKDAVAKLRKL